LFHSNNACLCSFSIPFIATNNINLILISMNE
jgi:hypothetical protein